MEEYQIDFLKKLISERTNYSLMIEFCTDNLVLNNSIMPELEGCGYYFDIYCGSLSYSDLDDGEYDKDFYQYYIIDDIAADRFAEYTDEVVFFNEQLDLYLLAVDHYGTPWQSVPANWKKIEN